MKKSTFSIFQDFSFVIYMEFQSKPEVALFKKDDLQNFWKKWACYPGLW